MAPEIRLMGGFAVHRDGRVISPRSWSHRRAAELVKILALQGSRRLHREQVMDLLWPRLTVERRPRPMRCPCADERGSLMQENHPRSRRLRRCLVIGAIPGVLMVTADTLTSVLSDDCSAVDYPSGSALIDPGQGTLHWAANNGTEDVVLYAIFFGVANGPVIPATPPPDCTP